MTFASASPETSPNTPQPLALLSTAVVLRSIRQESDDERDAVEHFILHNPEFARAPHEVTLQFMDRRAGYLHPEEMKQRDAVRAEGISATWRATQDFDDVLTSDDLS